MNGRCALVVSADGTVRFGGAIDQNECRFVGRVSKAVGQRNRHHHAGQAASDNGHIITPVASDAGNRSVVADGMFVASRHCSGKCDASTCFAK